MTKVGASPDIVAPARSDGDRLLRCIDNDGDEVEEERGFGDTLKDAVKQLNPVKGAKMTKKQIAKVMPSVKDWDDEFAWAYQQRRDKFKTILKND
ncbi:hypothetical protein PI124_g21949 [Phytophthora idaei]|nr:hypothetical protein PI125_g23817 [Phytophthora idaei]KAG3127520.1 hypothetical protein PI126_g21816 [Phytophthora idaei]KAG3232974.1 hypothetical protein PI124_g21949 [Phytophthora idaei]